MPCSSSHHVLLYLCFYVPLSALSLSIISFFSIFPSFLCLVHLLSASFCLHFLCYLFLSFLSNSVSFYVFAKLYVGFLAWELFMPQLPMPTSSSSDALNPIIFFTFLGQILTTMKPKSNKECHRKMRMILMGVRSSVGFTAVTESFPLERVSRYLVV